MAFAFRLVCLCGTFLLFHLARARNVIVNIASCAAVTKELGSYQVARAVDEAINMASNAATLMANAAMNPDTPDSKRVRLIAKQMLGCDPQRASCQLAKTYFSKIGQLTRSKKSGDDDLYIYCREDTLRDDLSRGTGPPHQQLRNRKMCGSHSYGLYASPNVILFCPYHWAKATTDNYILGSKRTQDLTHQHIDNLVGTSTLLVHEFAHALSLTSIPNFDKASDVEGWC